MGVDDGWTLDQVHALKIAYHRVDPAQPNFWPEVAKSVYGKTANECFAKVHDKQASVMVLESHVPRVI